MYLSMSTLRCFGGVVRLSALAAARARIAARPGRLLSTTTTSTTSAEDDSTTEQASEDPASAALSKRCADLQASVDQLQDKYVRALAESENTRRRLTRQADDARVFGIAAFCKDLLEVADVLARANESAPVGADATLVEGLRMTEAQLQQVFRRHKLDKIEPTAGDKFDPNLHEALFEVPAGQGNCAPGTVAVVTKVGYRLQERTLRPALVGVVKYT